MADNNDFTHEFQIYTTDLNAGTMGTGKFLLFDNNINALKVESIDNIKIGGGANGRLLATDGEGNLRWISAAAGTGGVSSYNELEDLPTLFSGSYNDLTNKPTIPGEVSLGNFIFSLGDASLPAGGTMTLSTFRSGANEESRLTLSPTTESSLYAAGVLKLGTGYGSGSEQYWQFGANGVLTIPGSGDIVQNGVSVLGGSGPTNEITNTNGIGATYAVSVGTDGVVTMNTARGGIEFGAQPEVGGPDHLHIMRPAGQNGATDLYFGDDYNYVKMPGLYGSNPNHQQGVEIGSSLNEGTVSVWKFGTDGDLVLPAGKTIRDTSGIDLFADPSTGDPAYKGFKASYGRMWGNTEDPNGPINKIVIYKDTATPSSTIDTSANNDTFTVTGLTGSDVVVMLVAIGEDVNQTTTAELKTFAESIIDNVILDGGVEGDINTADAMKTAFYANFATFSATLNDLKTGFEFFSVNNQFNLSPAFETGKGATFSSLQYNMSNDTIGSGSWGQDVGTHQVGDVFVIPGNTIQDADGNFLATPANDITITLTASVDGYINDYTVTGTLPRPAETWPTNSIGDGGDDEYDTGNYIATNLSSNISYNSGDLVTGSEAFGGGDYVVTYKDSIFGVFAVNPVISSIGTTGASGMDGYGQADTGSLYGAASSGVSIGDFVFTNSTMTASDDDLYIKAVDDLWLDALEDDVHIRANDDVRIKAGFDFANDTAESEWKFGNEGIIYFPNGSEQSTAWMGNVDWDNVNNRPTIPADVSDLTDTTNLLFSGAYADLSNAPILFSGEYSALTGKPTLFDGDYNSLTNKPTIRIAVATGSGPGGNLQADSLALAGLNPVTDIPSTWGGDLILQGGVGGANGDLYGEVRIKSGQIGANYEWHFTTDKKIKLPAGGNIVDSTGATAFVSLSTLKQVVADSTDFADFQTRIANM